MTTEATADTAAHDGTDAVRLTYTMNEADHRAAIRAWFRTRWYGRLMRLPVLVAVEALALTWLFLLARQEETPASVILAGGLAGMPLFLLLTQRFTARNAAKANAHHGEITVTVSGAGVRMTSAQADFSCSWSNFGRFLETSEGYLLLSPDKHGNQVYLLLKRGLADEGDATRLHTLVTTHLDGPGRRP